jgi:hypothetical protein
MNENRRYTGPRKTVLRLPQGNNRLISISAGDNFSIDSETRILTTSDGQRVRLGESSVEKLENNSIVSGARDSRAKARGRTAPKGGRSSGAGAKSGRSATDKTGGTTRKSPVAGRFNLNDTVKEDFEWRVYKAPRGMRVKNKQGNKQIAFKKGTLFGIMYRGKEPNERFYIADEEGVRIQINASQFDKLYFDTSNKSRRKMSGAFGEEAAPAARKPAESAKPISVPRSESPDPTKTKNKRMTDMDRSDFVWYKFGGARKRTLKGKSKSISLPVGDNFGLREHKSADKVYIADSEGKIIIFKIEVAERLVDVSKKLRKQPVGSFKDEKTAPKERDEQPNAAPREDAGKGETVVKAKYTGRKRGHESAKGIAFTLAKGDIFWVKRKGGKTYVKLSGGRYMLMDTEGFEEIEKNSRYSNQSVESDERPLSGGGRGPKGDSIRRGGAEDILPEEEDSEQFEPGDYIKPGTKLDDMEVEDDAPVRDRHTRMRPQDLADKNVADERARVIRENLRIKAEEKKAAQGAPKATADQVSQLVDALRESGDLEGDFETVDDLVVALEELSVPDVEDTGVSDELVQLYKQFYNDRDKVQQAMEEFINNQSEPEDDTDSEPEDDPEDDFDENGSGEPEDDPEDDFDDESLDELDEGEEEVLEEDEPSMVKMRFTKSLGVPTSAGKLKVRAGSEWELSDEPNADEKYDAIINGKEVTVSAKIAGQLKDRSEVVSDDGIEDLDELEEDVNP